MGCAQSKIENEEAVARCKDRKVFMKDAVVARNAFAAAHSSYIMALKNTGSALSEYGQGEVGPVVPFPSGPSSSASASVSVAATVAAVAAAQPPIENLPPPPPPLPEFSPSPLQRSTSMPDLPLPSKKKRNPEQNPSPADAVIHEEDEGGEDGNDGRVGSGIPEPPHDGIHSQDARDHFFHQTQPSLGGVEVMQHDDRMASASVAAEANVVGGGGGGDVPPVAPEKVVMITPPPPHKHVKNSKQGGSVHHQHVASVGAWETKRGKIVAASAPSVNLVQMLTEVDDHFLKASESAFDVSKNLEAARLHYHSNFADNRGHIDHSARVMRVITWNRSFKGIPSTDDGKDDFDNDESETHATILDKLLAWEKKLYDEVKVGELMKIEYQRKVALLNKQKKFGRNPEALEKAKAAVSHLHTRYIVDMQSMDSTVSEIQHLRDDQLYPRLVALVDGMAKMWESMREHHESQLRAVMDLKALDISSTPKEAGEQHYARTAQVHQMASDWHLQFQKFVMHQKEYVQALSNWLKLNLIPIESSLKEKVSSPPRIDEPPIQALLDAWNDHLEKLPDELAKNAIYSFAAVINAIMVQQQEELKQKGKCEETRKECLKKERAFNDWLDKYNSRKPPSSEEADHKEEEDNVNQKDPVGERQFVVESLKKKLEEEDEQHRRVCKQVREKSVSSLKSHLPELFRAMLDFSLACTQMYKNLKDITQMQNQAATIS